MMKIADFVREVSTSVGTGDFSLDGAAAANYRTFSSVLSVNDTCIYTIRSRTSLDAESGIGQFTGTGIVRQTILESTNANAPVSFPAGTKDIFISPVNTMFPPLADNQVWIGRTNNVPIAGALPVSTKEGFWRFATSTVMADPGTGKFRFNVATPSTATAMAISAITDRGTDVTNALKALVSGDTVQVQDQDNSANWARYTLSGPAVNNTTWFQLPFTYISGGGSTISNNTPCVLSFTVGGANNLVPPITLASPAISVVPLTLKGFSGQTASLLEFQDSTPTTVSSIGPNGRFRAPDGLVSSPGFQFQSDTDTGLYHSAADTFQLVTGGTARITVSASIAATGGLTVTATDVNTVPILAKGVSGQVSNLLEARDNTPTTRLAMGPDGSLIVNVTTTSWLLKDASANTLQRFYRLASGGWTDSVAYTQCGLGVSGSDRA